MVKRKKAWDPHFLEALDNLNTLNMILYHEEQLRQVMDGASIQEAFTQKERKILKRLNILVKNEERQRTDSALKLHWITKSILNRLNS